MLVGLVAPAGSRKTTAAKHLQKAYGFSRYHAGTPVKKAMEAFGLDKADMQDDARKDAPNFPKLGGATNRSVSEAVGDAIHEKAPQATSLAMHKAVMPMLADGKSVVVDGVRSKAEAGWIKKRGGIIVGVNRGKQPDPAKPLDQRQAEIVADHTVDATGSKDDLRRNVDALMAKCAGT